jgi:signal transduction histidine kinase/CheY-like chemotaxis protein/HPt (histidine-containing phosphotransfer) domain-containing protein
MTSFTALSPKLHKDLLAILTAFRPPPDPFPENEVKGMLDRIVSVVLDDRLRLWNTELITILSDVAAMLLAFDDEHFDATITKCLSLVCAPVHADRARVWKITEGADGVSAEQLFEWARVYPTMSEAAGVSMPISKKYPNLFRAWMKLPQINGPIKDLPYPDEARYFIKRHIVSVLDIPIWFGNTLWGHIFFDDCERERSFPPDETVFMTVCCMLIASALARHGANLRVIEREHRMSVVTDVALSLSRSNIDSFEERVTQALADFGKMAGADRMRLWKHHDDEGALKPKMIYEWAGNAQATAGTPLSEVEAWKIPETLHEIFKQRDSLNGAVSTFPPAVRFFVEEYEDIRSVMMIPLYVGDLYWGALVVDDCHREHSWSTDEENALRSAGVMLANTVMRNEMTHNLITAREDAVMASNVKRDFLANMSHEMRTPLNAIIGFAELELHREGEPWPAAGREAFEKIYQSSITLLNIINDILDISKIESGKMVLSEVAYCTPSVLNDTIQLNIVRIGSKPITFHLDIEDNLPMKLYGDDLRVREILNNLLSNAFKYTKEGEVTLKVRTARDEDNPDSVWLTISVTDTGIGIKAKDQEQLFSEYNQVNMRKNRRLEGTGLGLAITKRLVELMDGTIHMDSVYGRGSTFTARVRQGFVTHMGIGKRTADNLRSFTYMEERRDRSRRLVRVKMPGTRVLVVDDVQTNLDVIRGMLVPYDITVDCAMSGAGAIKMLQRPDVFYNAVFMDHMMPEMDGIETTAHIRALGTERALKVPIIALTANALVGNKQMFLEAGMQDYLTKPIDIMKLDNVLKRWVHKPTAKETKAAQAGAVADAEPAYAKNAEDTAFLMAHPVAGINFVGGLKRFEDAAKYYIDTLESFAERTPASLEKLGSLAAGELDDAALKDYMITVHGIKGASLSIEAKELGQSAAELEAASRDNDTNYITMHTATFIALASKVIGDLKDMLALQPKKSAREPDKQTLKRLRDAAKSYDIEAVDAAMADLESYRYDLKADLVPWLREKVTVSDFAAIVSHLGTL